MLDVRSVRRPTSAVFAGLRRPDVFGKVIGQATAVTEGAGPPVFAPLVVEPGGAPISLYLDVGLLETDATGARSFLAGNRKLSRDLAAGGHEVHYAELPCGHDEVTLRESIADGLRLLLGDPAG